MNFVIELTPVSKHFKRHLWVEGGTFATKEAGEFQAKQIRKMKDTYKKVEVIPFKLSLNNLISFFSFA